VYALDWVERLAELKRRWKEMWRDRIDDKVRAEGIADRDYPMLFVDRGTVVIATRDFRPLDFAEIVRMHVSSFFGAEAVVRPSPSVGGWAKFVREFVQNQKASSRRVRPAPSRLVRDESQPKKKGGRGWLHYSLKK